MEEVGNSGSYQEVRMKAKRIGFKDPGKTLELIN